MKVFDKIEHTLDLSDIKDEFRIWNQMAKPSLSLPENVLTICEYGFTEVLNNAIDHSDGESVDIKVCQDESSINIEIADNGKGIFNRIRDHFNLDSNIHSLTELAKGKLTIAPLAHSGEGLFFCSKMFDLFEIESGSLFVRFSNDQCEVKNKSTSGGTVVRMQIARDSKKIAKDVFDWYCDDRDYVFYKTRFSVFLSTIEGSLISRSQAKRLASRLESFSEVELNFSDVKSIGQGFADELFRVWPMAHPETEIFAIKANAEVEKMISHVKNRADLPQPSGVKTNRPS